MSKRLFIDLLMVTLLMAAAVCVAKGILESSIASYFGAWVLVIGAALLWLESRRARRDCTMAIDDSARPRTEQFK